MWRPARKGDDVRVDVELLVIPECPGTEEASALLRTALDDIGLTETAFTVSVIANDEVAHDRTFAGSPSFVVDGSDLFETRGEPDSLACRIYRTADGPRNVPSLRDLQQALKQRADSTPCG